MDCNLAVKTLSIILGVSILNLLINLPVKAATMVDFSVLINSGTNTGDTFNGSFTYDETKVNSSGLTNLTPANRGVLDVSFTYLGINYTANDDDNSPNGPIISFQNGTLTGLDFLVDSTFFINISIFTELDVNNNPINNQGIVSYGTPVIVPEKTINPLLLMGFLGLGIARKRLT